jgi:Lon protease-like protein
MNRLPLFPLPVVLLPGTRMPLHIFEMRYRRLVQHCVERQAPFGIVYHDPDRHGPFLIEEGRVGTEARIEAYRPFPDGRSMILVRGGERFHIAEEVDSPEPYYEAVVAAYPDAAEAENTALAERRCVSIELFQAALAVLSDGPVQVPPLDPSRETSFLLADFLRIEPSWLQALLELPTETRRLERLDAIFRAALDRERPSGSGPPRSEGDVP